MNLDDSEKIVEITIIYKSSCRTPNTIDILTVKIKSI